MSPALPCFLSEKCNFAYQEFFAQSLRCRLVYQGDYRISCVLHANRQHALHSEPDYAASGAKEVNPPLASSHAEAMDMRAEVSPLAVCAMLQKRAPDRRILRELPVSSAPEKISGRCLRPLLFEYHQCQKIRQVAGQRQSLRCVRGPHLQRRFPQRGS